MTNGTTQETQTGELVTRHYQQANQFYQAGNYQQAYHELRQARQHAQDQTQIEHIEKNIRELEGMMQESDVTPVAGEAEQPATKREPNKMAILTVLVGLICLTPIVMKCIEIFSQPGTQTAAVVEENTENTESPEASSPTASEASAESPATPQATPNVIVEEDVNGNLIPAGAPDATVSGDSINLRESPSTQAAALGTLSKGQRVTLLANASVTADGYTWSQIQTAAGATGWIASQFVQSSNSTAAAPEASTSAAPATADSGLSANSAAAPAATRQVSGTGVSLRGTPSTSGALLTTLSQTEVTVLSDSPVNADGYSWTKVRTRNGSEGWIASQFLN
ncbi:MAG: SH3 domain-containing protein [Candidatus Sericytochromatia bacterium]|nr:SH3 domain-containing protein [Candidatus Sericytochromatia bacterium]